MNNFDFYSSPVIVVSGGGGGAPVIAHGIAEVIPNAEIVLAQGTADGTGKKGGGATGELRRALSIPAVGDLRTGIAAFSNPEEAALFSPKERFGADTTAEDVREHGDALFDLIRKNRPELNETWLAMQLDDTDELVVDFVTKGYSLKGHIYGNFVLAAATVNSSIGEAVKTTSTLMGLPANRIVMPTTLETHDLVLHDRDIDGNEFVIFGEGEIDEHPIEDPDFAYTELCHDTAINPELAEKIKAAAAYVLAAGSYLTSVRPALLNSGTVEAFSGMSPDSKIVAVANITEEPVMKSMPLGTYVQKLETLTNPNSEGKPIDYVLFHNSPETLPLGVKPAAHAADQLGHLERLPIAIGGDLADKKVAEAGLNDAVVRSSIHHNGPRVGEIIKEQILTNNTSNAIEAAA